MSGVRKQTNSSHDSKRSSIIKKMNDGRELEEGLTRTPIIQRNSDIGGKEQAHLVGSALLSTLFFLRTSVIRGTDKEGATSFRRKT